jgi:hypothetical protein
VDAKELFLEDGKPTGIFFCSQCRIVSRDKEFADKCCVPDKCRICGEDVPEKHWSVHRSCREKEIFDKSEKLTSWDGWVCADGIGHNDGYFESVEELKEYCEDEEIELPEYVHPCIEVSFEGVDLERAIERVTEEMFEDAWDHLKGLSELEEAVKVFNEKNKELVTYIEDPKRVILLHENGYSKEEGK